MTTFSFSIVMRCPSGKRCRVAVAKGDHSDPRATVLETMIPDRAGRCYPALGVRACTHMLGTRKVNILEIDFNQASHHYDMT